MTVKRLQLAAPTVDFENRLIQGIASAETRDLEGDLVKLDGIDTSYFFREEIDGDGNKKELGTRTVYRDHDYDRPVGRCCKMKKQGGGLYVQTYVTELPIGDELLTLVKEGIVNGLSVGFRAMEASEPTMEEMAKHGRELMRVIRRCLLLEYSFTPMPCNPDAMLKTNYLVATKRLRQTTADWIAKSVVTSQPQTLLTAGRVFTIN